MAKIWWHGPLPNPVRERDYHSGGGTIALPREGAGGSHRVFSPPLLFGPFFLQLLPLPLALQCLFPLLDIQFFRGARVFPEAQGFCELAGKRYRTPIALVVEFVLVLDVDHSFPVLDLIGESRHRGSLPLLPKGVDHAQALVVLLVAQILRVHRVATADAGGGENRPVPVRQSEALTQRDP